MRSRRRRSWLLFSLRRSVCPAAALATLFACPLLIIDLKIDKVRRGQIPIITDALAAFRADYGRLPTEQEGLSALLNPPGNESHPYFRKLPIDPWGGSYIYHPVGDGEHFSLYSLGRNGVDEHGGGDDVVNWEKNYTCEDYGVGCRRPCEIAQASALVALVLWLVVGGTSALLFGVNWLRRKRTHVRA